MPATTFLREFFRNWKTVGAVAPSSPGLAAEMMKSAGVGEARHILELGPGTGAFTAAIQDAMPEGSHYLGIEINTAFADQLRSRFTGMNFEVAGAQEFDFKTYLIGKPPIDVIVSGLPWTAFPPSLQEAILSNVLPHLSQGGRFATFAYFGFHLLPSGRRFRQLLKQHLTGVKTSQVVWPNIPPAFVYIGGK
jgi:phosphatidylethanolamine/phosphatidyl-N-methylethanolamine N-methyltransferase